MTLTHINPETLHRNPAFSQGVLIEPPGALLVVGGQNGVDAQGVVVGDDVESQAAQALRNVLAVLASVGATQADVAKLTVYLATGSDAASVYTAAGQVWGRHATAISVLVVSGLARADCLVEIEALAQVPEGHS